LTASRAIKALVSKKPQSTPALGEGSKRRPADWEEFMRTRYALSIAILGLALLPFAAAPASASIAGMTQSAAIPEETMVIEVARAYRGGGARVNRNINVNRNVRVNRNVNVNRNVRVNRNVNVNRVGVVGGRGLYRSSYVYRGGPWVRPRGYWWPVGGAIAAGAALGMVAASTAVWAGPAPGRGYCWYYTDPSQQQGFWDQCQ
jgi:hypothetical protein